MAVDGPRAKSLFLAASDLDDPAERAAYLDRECGDDVELRERVEALLRANDESPLAALEPTVNCDPGAAAHAATGEYTPGPHQAEGLVIAGRYTLQQKIGEGGMGEVWVARQTEPVKRKVALKLIKTGMDSRAVVARFEHERQALALMDHPNIARVLDGGLTPTGQPFFVMELVNGLPLNRFCDEARMTPKERLELFVPICHAIQHAHQKGIVHRDLKPTNILVTMIDARPVPKVIDFGVAKATAGKLTDESMSTRFGDVVGTLEYMSPEQAGFSGEDIDTRADIYSLGVILYELLTGLKPIDAARLKKAGLAEMLRILKEEEPSKPSTRLSTDGSMPSMAALRQTEPRKLTALLRGELDWVVMKCLEKQRDRRYETASALARDLQRYLADEAVEARPPSAGYRLKKSLKRNKGKVIAAAAVVIALCVGLVAFAWQAKVARDQRDLAIKAQAAEAEQRNAADKAREAEADAHQQTERALIESREKTARMTYERAQALCEADQADLGLLWMARSLELTPPGAADLDRAIRTSINLWAQQLNTVGRAWSSESQEANTNEVSLSPDGLSMLIIDAGGMARLWETSTGKLRFVLPLEPDAPAPEGVRFNGTFSTDGRFVAIARSDKRARVWQAATGKLVGQPLVHEEPVTGVSFDPTGNVLVTSAGNKIHFWNVEGSVEDGEPISSEQDNRGVEVSSDGRHLLAWSDGQVTVWEFASRQHLYSLEGIDFSVYHAGFSPSGRWVLGSGIPRNATSGLQMTAQFWHAASGRPVGKRMTWENSRSAGEIFNRPCFGPDGRLLVTGGSPLRMWRVPTGTPVGAVASMSWAERPVFQPDGKTLVAFRRNVGARYFLDIAPALDPIPIVSGFGDQHRSTLGFAPDGRTMIRTYSRDGRSFCQLYELPSGKAVGELLDEEGADEGYADPAQAVFSADGRSVAIRVGNDACQIFDTATGRARTPRMMTDSPDTGIRALAFSPDGQLLASGDLGGTVRLWSTATGQPASPPMVHERAINQIRFSPDSLNLLVAGGQGNQSFGEARLWEVATGEPLGPDLELDGPVHDAAFSPDGKTFATGSFQLVLWDAETRRKIWTASSHTKQLAFTPDGKTLLALHVQENAARLYDVHSGKPASPLLRHQKEVVSTALSHDGRLVLTSSQDGTARLWDASLGLQLGPDWSIVSADRIWFRTDGQSVLMRGQMNNLERWNIPPPLEGTPERIRLAIEAATRLSLDPFGAVQFLAPRFQFDPATKQVVFGPDPYDEKRLEELGGPPGAFRR